MTVSAALSSKLDSDLLATVEDNGLDEGRAEELESEIGADDRLVSTDAEDAMLAVVAVELLAEEDAETEILEVLALELLAAEDEEGRERSVRATSLP
jgi:hypothetical protein